MTKSNGKSVITSLIQPGIIITIGALSRLIPHPANFTPIAAVAIFGGTYLGKKQAIIIPLLAMIVSDLFIGFDSGLMRLTVYGCFLISVFIGFWLKKHRTFGNIALGSLASSLMFFFITNFAVWAFSGMYTHTFFGLTQCYFLAIPFFRNTLLGDLFYTGVFFGGYELVRNYLVKIPIAPTNKT